MTLTAPLKASKTWIRYADQAELNDRAPSRFFGAEAAELQRLKDPSRRAQWLLGRALARELLVEAGFQAPSETIQILTRNSQGQGDRPRILVEGREVDWSLSISHSTQGALVALCQGAESVGVDLVDDVPDSDGFRQLWFTSRERAWLQGEPTNLAQFLWAVKEAVYKACQRGESWSPLQIEVLPGEMLGENGSSDCRFFGRTILVTVECRNFAGQLGVIVHAPGDGSDFQ